MASPQCALKAGNFGFDTSMILVLEYARRLDEWWRREGRALWLAGRVETAGVAA